MKLFFLLLLYCTDTDGDGVDLESLQGLGSDIPTIPEVNIHVHVGDVASSSSQRVDGPAEIAKEKFEKPTQPVSIDFPLSVFGKGSRSFKPRWYQQFPWLEYSKSLDAAFFVNTTSPSLNELAPSARYNL